MPQAVAPREIQVSDFTAGWTPDLEAMSLPPNALQRVKNLLPNAGDGTLITRKGSKRLPNLNLQGYTVRTISPFNRLTSSGTESYLIVVGTTKVAAVANNVKIVAYNLDTEVATTISPSATIWADASGLHYGVVVNNTFYGGTEKDPMYSWNPVDGWNSDAAAKTFDAFVADKAYPDYATVTYNGENYSVNKGKGNRTSTKYESDSSYKKSDEVSLKGTWGYWKTFRCKKDHKNKLLKHSPWDFEATYYKGDKVTYNGSSWRAKETSLNSSPGLNTAKWKKTGEDKNEDREFVSKPGVGKEWEDYWKLVILPTPVDEDGKKNKKWTAIPTAPKSRLATWWANRLWIRPDNKNKQVMEYSHLVDEETLKWDPTDWSQGSIEKGVETVAGAGYVPFKSGDGDRITAAMPYGAHQIVFTQKKSFVLTGENPENQYKREIAPVGCVGARAVTEHEGLIYFFSDEGIFYTDGTELQPVPGLDQVREWLGQAVRWDGNLDYVTMWSSEGLVWIALPTGKDNLPDRTLVYDPDAESFVADPRLAVPSFWKLDFAPTAVAINRKNGQDRVFFSRETEVGEMVDAVYAWEGGIPHAGRSTRTIGLVTKTNQIVNPSFELRNSDHSPWNWSPTNAAFTKAVVSNGAARRGSKGVEFTNKRRPGDVDEGLVQSFADPDIGTQTIAVYARRPHFNKRPDAAPPVKVRIGSTDFTPTFEKVGRGWWKVSHQFTGSLTARAHGFVVQANRTVEFDMAWCVAGTGTPYFDGNGGTGQNDHRVSGGAKGLVYMYGYDGATPIYTDDDGQDVYSPRDISWSMRTAWFPFGMFREERRIRRVWAMTRGSVNTLIRGFSNYGDDPVVQGDALPGADNTVQYLEGVVGNFPDSYAVAFAIEGESSPAAVQGFGIDTQTRRSKRFGS